MVGRSFDGVHSRLVFFLDDRISCLDTRYIVSNISLFVLFVSLLVFNSRSRHFLINSSCLYPRHYKTNFWQFFLVAAGTIVRLHTISIGVKSPELSTLKLKYPHTLLCVKTFKSASLLQDRDTPKRGNFIALVIIF